MQTLHSIMVYENQTNKNFGYPICSYTYTLLHYVLYNVVIAKTYCILDLAYS